MRYGMMTAAVLMAAVLAGCAGTADQSTSSVSIQRNDCIETRCVAAYYSGTTPYWTDQHQQFCPASVLFEAQGTEPEGAYKAVYSKGQFSASGLDGTAMKALPAGLMNGPLAELVYYSFTTGAGFVPSGLQAIESISIEGQRYEAFGIKGGSGRSVTLHKNAVTGHYELVRVQDGKGLDWMARSYNPRYNDRFKRMIPRKIDVFDIQQGIAAKKLQIQFEYVDLQ